MLETDKVFAGSVPENYDRYMVPLIFAPYAADLAERAASLSPYAVLEIAAGTGVVTRALSPKLSPDASYFVTDLNQPMLDYAASRQGPDTRITWRQANALALPFENAAFDVVCCQFGAMFFPDRSAAYREAKRVLKPGGHLLFSVWDRIEENVFADDVTKALARIFPNDPPRFLARTPSLRRLADAADARRVSRVTAGNGVRYLKMLSTRSGLGRERVTRKRGAPCRSRAGRDRIMLFDLMKCSRNSALRRRAMLPPSMLSVRSVTTFVP
jgi:ubiquinone/menaquinone biosynthesis C-methylase UbiE